MRRLVSAGGVFISDSEGVCGYFANAKMITAERN